MKRLSASLILFLGLTACAGPGGMGPGGGLTYTVPDNPSLVYLTGDTSTIDIDAGPMGSMRIRGTGAATLGVTFARSPEGIQVTATFQELSARLTNPMGGAQTATQDDVEGNLVFTMDRQGHSSVVSVPETRGAAGQLANPEALAYELFPLLPGGTVNPGETWTDTLHYQVDSDEATTESTSVRTYTLQGDTVVDGRTLLHITMSGRADVMGTGSNQGMEVTQIFAGDVEGTIFWDPARAVYVYGVFEQDMDGTVEVPGAGMPPMPLTVRGISHVRLREN
jgi:hypothetical protein